MELTVQNTQAQTSQPSRNHAGTERSRKNIEEIMAENFQNLSTNTNLYIQEAHLILNGINLDLQTCNLVGGKKG